jgi:hypothetical protein
MLKKPQALRPLRSQGLIGFRRRTLRDDGTTQIAWAFCTQYQLFPRWRATLEKAPSAEAKGERDQ